MRTSRIITAATAVALQALVAGSVAAQRPYLTVGGTNPNFQSLPAAVAAAAPGSVIEVRPGTYTGFTTSKPLRLVLDFTFTSGTIVAPTGAAYALELNGIPAGQDFVIVGRGARIAAGTLGAIRVANTAGRVVIDGVGVAVSTTRDGLDVQNAASVIVQNSSFFARHGLQLQDASIVASDVAFRSGASFGVVALRGRLDFALGRYEGDLAPAIRATDSVLRLAGDGSTPMVVNGSTSAQISAFEAIQSDVQWNANRFTLVPKNGAPAFVQVGGALIVEDVPALTAQGAPPGGTMSVSMLRVTPGFGAILLGNLTLPATVFGVSGVHLAPALPIFAVAVGPVNATSLSLSVNWPNAPWLLGETFACQGVMFTNGNWLRTNPAVWASM